MREIVIQLRNLSKWFGNKVAVESLDAAIPRGSICGFLGPNGSGKTTTLRLILGIFEPDRGGVEVLGHGDPRQVNKRIGYLPEERGLYRKMKLQHQLEYLGRLKGVPRKELKKRIEHWLERMDLAGVANQRIETLSKGMSQKAQFIGTILNEPEILVLDEPFSGLDPVNREVIRAAILEHRERGATILFSTHDMASAEVFCDRFLMLSRAQKVLDGSLTEIQAEYGGSTVRVRLAKGRSSLDGLVSPKLIVDEGQIQHLTGVEDPQALLDALRARDTIQYFEVAPPRLQDIFMRLARPDETFPSEPVVAATETEGVS